MNHPSATFTKTGGMPLQKTGGMPLAKTGGMPLAKTNTNTNHNNNSKNTNTTNTSHTLKKDDDFILEKQDGQETYLFDPYNPLNREIEQSDVERIFTTYGLANMKPHHFVLYRRAFIHKSYIKRPVLINEQNNVRIAEKPADCLELSTKSNERLEFLGDGVLECIAKFYLYKRL